MRHDLVITDPECSTQDGLERSVVDACRCLGTSDSATIRSITVVGGRRLSGPGLLRLHAYAELCGVQIVMAADGAVTVRREEVTRPQFARAFVPEIIAAPDAV